MKVRLTLGASTIAAISVLVALFAFGSTAGASHFRGNGAAKASFTTTVLQNSAVAAAVVCPADNCDPNGAFLANNGGFLQLTHPSTGHYCLRGKGIRSSNRTASVTVEYGYSSGQQLLATTRWAASSCPQYWFEVDTIDTGLNAFADTVAFSIVVT
jgi:hypothetical protein